jgi:hypothetical protein
MFGDQKECGTTCLYGPSDYASGTTGHPPVVGFSYDGHVIYGRYLDESAPGYASPKLDVCGGHSHTAADVDEYGNSLQTYHYHTQIFDATVESGQTATEGEAYIASTTGPFQCFMGDLDSVEGSSALLAATASSAYKAKNEMSYYCCDMTDYYLYNGVNPGGGSSIDSSSMCIVPADPANGQYSTYAGERVCTAGDSIYSGNACIPNCDSGYVASGMTMCVGGVITSTASCVAETSAPTSKPTTSTYSCYDDDAYDAYSSNDNNNDGDDGDDSSGDDFFADDDETGTSSNLIVIAVVGAVAVIGVCIGIYVCTRDKRHNQQQRQNKSNAPNEAEMVVGAKSVVVTEGA